MCSIICLTFRRARRISGFHAIFHVSSRSWIAYASCSYKTFSALFLRSAEPPKSLPLTSQDSVSFLGKAVMGFSSTWKCVLQAVLQKVQNKEGKDPSAHQKAFMQSRFALLQLLSNVLHASSKLQSQAVRTWDPITAVFCLFHDQIMRPVALKVVRRSQIQTCCILQLESSLLSWEIASVPNVAIVARYCHDLIKLYMAPVHHCTDSWNKGHMPQPIYICLRCMQISGNFAFSQSEPSWCQAIDRKYAYGSFDAWSLTLALSLPVLALISGVLKAAIGQALKYGQAKSWRCRLLGWWGCCPRLRMMALQKWLFSPSIQKFCQLHWTLGRTMVWEWCSISWMESRTLSIPIKLSIKIYSGMLEPLPNLAAIKALPRD